MLDLEMIFWLYLDVWRILVLDELKALVRLEELFLRNGWGFGCSFILAAWLEVNLLVTDRLLFMTELSLRLEVPMLALD